MQLDIFDENTEIMILKRELDEVKERSENARKGLFARHNELIKLYMSLKMEIEHLKAIQVYKQAKEKVEYIPFFTEMLETYR